MRTSELLRRSLIHYWRTNLAVVIGVAAAVAVLAGALLVGDSVRASLRDLFLMTIGTNGSCHHVFRLFPRTTWRRAWESGNHRTFQHQPADRVGGKCQPRY